MSKQLLLLILLLRICASAENDTFGPYYSFSFPAAEEFQATNVKVYEDQVLRHLLLNIGDARPDGSLSSVHRPT